MRITVVGTGYVGTTTAVALAYLGHQVTCVDQNAELVERLRDGQIPLHEPGLTDLFNQVRSRLRFQVELTAVDCAAEVILICVGTPTQANGDADLRYVEEVALAIARALPEGAGTVVVNKSTVPVGSARRVEAIIRLELERRSVAADVAVASNPEFLREGAALLDTFYPDRIVIGTELPWAAGRLQEMYRPILEQSFVPPSGLARSPSQSLPTLVITTPTSAELAKYAANTFLAMKISFANEVGGIAERVGADITEVMRVVGLDERIGSRYLGAGAGWGGSCFGKDLKALQALGAQYDYEMVLVDGAMRVNERQRRAVVEKLQAGLKVLRGSTVALWGLTFKPNTDDLRDAPAVEVARRLLAMGARVKAFDPVGAARAARQFPDLDLEYADSPLAAARHADAVVLMTEWDLFRQVDWQQVAQQMNGNVVVDGRNLFQPELLRQMGFQYFGMGR